MLSAQGPPTPPLEHKQKVRGCFIHHQLFGGSARGRCFQENKLGDFQSNWGLKSAASKAEQNDPNNVHLNLKYNLLLMENAPDVTRFQIKLISCYQMHNLYSPSELFIQTIVGRRFKTSPLLRGRLLHQSSPDARPPARPT